jgi:hypothetical protein
MSTTKTIKVNVTADVEVMRSIVKALRDGGLSPEQARKQLFQAIVLLGDFKDWDAISEQFDLDSLT